MDYLIERFLLRRNDIAKEFSLPVVTSDPGNVSLIVRGIDNVILSHLGLFRSISGNTGNAGVPAGIVEAFIAGDTDAFTFVYNKYRERIFSYCFYVMADSASAEDAFQEVWVKVYTNRSQLRQVKAIKSWLLMVARSVCMNLLRTSVFTPDFVSIDVPRDEEHREHLELSSENLNQEIPEQIFELAFRKIGPIYRDAFLLKEVEGYSYDEIAVMTGATAANVKVRINRAKKMLREILAPHFDIAFENIAAEEKIKDEKKKPKIHNSVLMMLW